MLPGGRHFQPGRAQAATVRTIRPRGDDAPASPYHFPQRVNSVLGFNHSTVAGARGQINMSRKMPFRSCDQAHKMG
jgi:hypothetical protein